MIAKVVRVQAELTDRIIQAKADFVSLLPVCAELVNPLTEGKVHLQEKDITPSEEDQTIVPDIGFAGLNKVVVHAIPNNYGLVSRVGSALVIS